MFYKFANLYRLLVSYKDIEAYKLLIIYEVIRSN